MEQRGRPLLHCSSAPERRGAGLEAKLGLPHARSASARLELAPSECTPSDSGAGEKVRRRRAGFWRASAMMSCHVCRVTARQRPAELDRWGASPSEWPSDQGDSVLAAAANAARCAYCSAEGFLAP